MPANTTEYQMNMICHNTPGLRNHTKGFVRQRCSFPQTSHNPWYQNDSTTRPASADMFSVHFIHIWPITVCSKLSVNIPAGSVYNPITITTTASLETTTMEVLFKESELLCNCSQHLNWLLNFWFFVIGKQVESPTVYILYCTINPTTPYVCWHLTAPYSQGFDKWNDWHLPATEYSYVFSDALSVFDASSNKE